MHAKAQTILSIVDEKNLPIEDVLVVVKDLESSKSKVYFQDKDKNVVLTETSAIIQVSAPGYALLSDTLNRLTSKKIVLNRLNKNLDEVVVTGQLYESSTDKTIHKVKVISRDRIEKQAAVNLRDVLSNELNIRLQQDNVLGSSFSLQGVGGQNIKLLIDGIPVIGRLDGNIDISQINLNNIERVEIVEGPMSVIYGTDALGGVINLITKKQSEGKSLVQLNSYYESVGTYNADGIVEFKLPNNNQKLKLSGGRNFFDGWDPNGNDIRNQQWRPKEQIFGNLQYKFNLAKTDHIFQIDRFYEKLLAKGSPIVSRVSAYAFDDEFITQRGNYNLTSNFILGSKLRLNLINGFQTFSRVRTKFRKNLVDLTENKTPTSSDHDTTQFMQFLSRATFNTFSQGKLNHQFGYDVNFEEAIGARLKSNNQSLLDAALFYSAEFQATKKLLLRPGIRAAYNSQYAAPVVPSFNLKYIISDKFVFRASYANGFRAPSLKELHLFFVDVNHNIQGNVNLKPEKSNNINAILSFQNTSKQLVYKVELTTFYNHITNMIGLAMIDQSTQLYSYINVNTFQTEGINWVNDFIFKELKLSLGWSRIGRNNIIENEFTQFSRKTFTDEYRVNLSYTIPKTTCSFNFFYKYNGAVDAYVFSNNEIVTTRLQGFQMADATVSVSFFKHKLQLLGAVKNIFNVTNLNFSGPAGGVHNQGNGIAPMAMGRYFGLGIKIIPFKS